MSKSNRSGKPKPPANPSEPTPSPWLEVYERIAPWAEITCIGEDHRDIMQDVMEKALTVSPHGHPCPDAWFKTCVRNRYLSIKKRQSNADMDAVSTQSGTYHMADVREVLEGIEPWKRDLFELHYLHGVPVGIISRQVLLNTNAIYTAINEAADIVKARLK